MAKVTLEDFEIVNKGETGDTTNPVSAGTMTKIHDKIQTAMDNITDQIDAINTSLEGIDTILATLTTVTETESDT